MKQRKNSNNYFTHNKIKLVHGGRPYFDLLFRIIDNAKHSIHFQTYIFSWDETGKQVTNKLLKAAQRGVAVFLLLDGYASQSLPHEFIESVQKAGIRFRFFEPLFRSKSFYFGRRLHHKVVVADSSEALVGGINISNRYNDTIDQPAWLDWALHVEGEIVPTLESICRKRMKHYRYHSIRNFKLHSIEHHHCEARVRVNDWVSGKRQISRSFLEMLREATSSVIIMSPYFLPGNEFKKRMVIAAKRDVKIKVILAGLSDITIAKWAERYVYQWLLRNNIEVYEYQKNILHGKIAVRDGKWLTAGSYNVNNLSAYASIELNIDVNDGLLASETHHKLERIIHNDCVRITANNLKKNNNLLRKLVQWISYELLRLLLFLTTFYFRSKE